MLKELNSNLSLILFYCLDFLIKLMRMSHRVEDDSLESILDPESGVLQPFSFSLVILDLL